MSVQSPNSINPSSENINAFFTETLALPSVSYDPPVWELTDFADRIDNLSENIPSDPSLFSTPTPSLKPLKSRQIFAHSKKHRSTKDVSHGHHPYTHKKQKKETEINFIETYRTPWTASENEVLMKALCEDGYSRKTLENLADYTLTNRSYHELRHICVQLYGHKLIPQTAIDLGLKNL